MQDFKRLLAYLLGGLNDLVLTSNTSEQLAGEALNLTAWKRCERIAFQKIKDALPEEIRHDADVVPEIEAITQMYAFVPVFLIVLGQGRQYTQLNA